MKTASRRSQRNLALAGLVTVLLAAFIVWGSFKPSSGGTSSLPLTDKQLHALAFAILVLPLSAAAPRLIPKIVVGAMLFGAMIELIQPSFGRTADIVDWFADIVGISMGIAVAYVLTRWRRTHQTNT